MIIPAAGKVDWKNREKGGRKEEGGRLKDEG
jgi:hypothetical protein